MLVLILVSTSSELILRPVLMRLFKLANMALNLRIITLSSDILFVSIVKCIKNSYIRPIKDIEVFTATRHRSVYSHNQK